MADCDMMLWACYSCCSATGGGDDCKQRCTDCYEKCFNGNPNCNHECWPGPNVAVDDPLDLQHLLGPKNVLTDSIIASLKQAALASGEAGRELVTADDLLLHITDPSGSSSARTGPTPPTSDVNSATRGSPDLFRLLAAAAVCSTRPSRNLLSATRALGVQSRVEGDHGFIGTKDVLLAAVQQGKAPPDLSVKATHDRLGKLDVDCLSGTTRLALHHAQRDVAMDADRPVTPECLLIGVLAQRERSLAWRLLQHVLDDAFLEPLATGLEESRSLPRTSTENATLPAPMVLPIASQTALKAAFRHAGPRLDTRHLVVGLMAGADHPVARLLASRGIRPEDLLASDGTED